MALAMAAANTSPATSRHVPPALSDSLELTLVVPERIRHGQSVPIRLRGRNLSGRVLDLYLRGRATTLDVLVTASDGAVVWQRLAGEIIPAIIHVRTLGPGEAFEAEVTWDQRTREGRLVAPGRYLLQGMLLTDGEPLATPSITLHLTGDG